MRVSVIIPTKNEARWLPRILECLQAQTPQPDEIIVADAASTDRTREIARAAGVALVEGGMPGPGRNRGAEVATGDVLLFLDADAVLIDPHFLADTLREMQERRLDVATCDLLPDRAHLLDQMLYKSYNWYALATERVLPHAAGTCIFVRRSVHEASGGFDERVVFAEDMEYVRRLKLAGYRFGILRTHPVHVSMRRSDKEGRHRMVIKYLYGEWHMLTRGPFFDRLPFSYVMGEYDAQNKSRDQV